MTDLAGSIKALVKGGNIGFYNSCSITSVILTSRKNGCHRNVFTIAVFEELPFRSYRLHYHTPGPVRVSSEWRLGVASQRVTVDDALSLYERLLRDGRWRQPECPELRVGTLTPLGPVFVPCTPGVPLHSVLKNPHRFASYVFEFFSEQKELYRALNPGYVQGAVAPSERKIYTAVQSVLPIDLEFIGDRWENIVFQLPVNLLKVDAWGDKDGKHIWVATRWHPATHDCQREVRIEAWAAFDRTIMGRASVVTAEPMVKLPVGCTTGEITVRVYSKGSDCLLYENSFHLLT